VCLALIQSSQLSHLLVAVVAGATITQQMPLVLMVVLVAVVLDSLVLSALVVLAIRRQ
jgi:hypothetical protein